MDLINDIKAKLHEELSDFDPNKGPQNTKYILKLLNVVLEQNEEHVSDRAPPLEAVIYALKGILYPTFLPEFMSEFLHLFTMVEFYRIRTTEKAALAIEMNTFYQSSPDPSISLLTTEEEEYLERLIASQANMREIYMTVVGECCVLDLKRHWLADSNADFWIRWNEYLSVLSGTNDKTQSHSFHYKLSTDEINGLRDVALAVWDFMKTTVEAGQQIEGQSIHQAIKAGDFQDAYLPQVIPLEAIEYHQNVVQEAVQKFNAEVERPWQI